MRQIEKSYLCGVTCTRGSRGCNGYCVNNAPHPGTYSVDADTLIGEPEWIDKWFRDNQAKTHHELSTNPLYTEIAVRDLVAILTDAP